VPEEVGVRAAIFFFLMGAGYELLNRYHDLTV
jgi:hypothetical protein